MRLIKIFAIGCFIILLAAGCRQVPAPPANLSQDWGRAADL